MPAKNSSVEKGRDKPTANGIDLIDEHDNLADIAREDDPPDAPHPALQRAELRLRFPELFELVFQVELLAHLAQQPAVPLLCGEVLPDRGEVEHRHTGAFLAQARRRAD